MNIKDVRDVLIRDYFFNRDDHGTVDINNKYYKILNKLYENLYLCEIKDNVSITCDLCSSELKFIIKDRIDKNISYFWCDECKKLIKN